MPWSNQGGGSSGGGGGGNRGPWGGQGPGGRPQSPDLEELLRKGQDRFRAAMPGGGLRSPRILILIGLAILAVWLLSGFYRVQADEQGVVMRFGEWTRTTQPGLHYHLPAPFEAVLTPKVTRNNRQEIGFRSASDVGRGAVRREVPEESLMLTGDENIVDIDFTVLWQIRNAGEFLFNIQAPEETIKAAAESAMRQIVGRTPIQLVLAEGRRDVETETQGLLQQIVDSYEAGVLILEVKLQRVDPPAAVIDSFRDVQRARADRDRQINEAQSYSNDILPRARGKAEQMRLDAEGYKEEVVRTAEGDAERFLSIYTQYALAPEVTVRRMFYETMEKVFAGMQKVIIDESAEGQGVVPYLPLDALTSQRRNQ
jgi:membrane protease subunit HflK